MKGLFEPLPFETGISTLIGAVLSFTFSQQWGVAHLASWKDVPRPMGFFSLIVLYVILMNLFCRGLISGRYGVVSLAGPGLLFVVLATNVVWSKKLSFPADKLMITPDKYIVFTTALLILWFVFSLLIALLVRGFYHGD